MTKSSDPAWLAESLRGTAFGEISIDEAKGWWSQFVDVDPESETVKAKAGQYSAHCDFMGGLLFLEVQPGRVDWHLRSKRPEENDELEFPSVGAIDAPLKKFSEIIKAWASDASGLARIAFGAVLFLPTEDRLGGYQAVQSMLPAVQIDIDNSVDFFYQINRPRPSVTGVDELIINRLCKWSVLRIFGGRYRMDSDKSLISTDVTEKFAVRLELDMNTSPDVLDVLPVDRQSDIFDELIELGLEISLQGDQP